jgi:hypothetical protein
MKSCVTIENIEGLRRQCGIVDTELSDEIQGLRRGDFVKLTFLPGEAASAGETLVVQVTRVAGLSFRGMLVSQPAASGLTQLKAGVLISFKAAHIHSLLRRRTSHEQ